MNWWTSTGFLIRSALPVRSKLAGFAERVFCGREYRFLCYVSAEHDQVEKKSCNPERSRGSQC